MHQSGLGHVNHWLAEWRPLLRLSVPLILSQAAQMGIMFIDAVLMGRLGPDALAAGALALASYYLCFVLLYGMSAAGGNLVALAHGRGNRMAVCAATRASLAWSAVMILIISLLLWHALPIMLWLGQAPATASQSASFLRILLWALPMNMLFLCLRSFAAGIGKPGPIPFITLSALIIAPCTGLLLSEGVGSWQGMGLQGIALSSVITYSWMAGVFLLVISRNPAFAGYRLWTRPNRQDLAMLVPSLRLGLPTAGTLAMESGMFSASAYMMGTLSTAALAAHQSMMQIVMFSFIIPLGLSQGTAMCVGQAAGAGQIQRVRHLGYLGQLLAVLWSLATACVLLFAPNLVLALFLPPDHPGAEAARAIARHLTPFAAMLF